MARVAPHVDAFVSARLDLLEVVVDGAKHPIHLAGAVFVGIRVGRKIVGTEWLAFFTHMTMSAAHAERAREASHDRTQPGSSDVLRKDLKILRFLRPGPWFLALSGNDRDEHQDDEDRS